MKPLRKLMSQIELASDLENINWAEQVDPKKTPAPQPVSIEDLTAAI